MTIEINNLTRRKIDLVKIRIITQKIVEKVKLHFSALDISFVSETEIKKINNRFRNQNKATDVLSFNYGDSGEIIICPGQALKQAKESGHSAAREIIILLVHAILHLKGYDHEKNSREEKLMCKREYLVLEHLREKHEYGKM